MRAKRKAGKRMRGIAVIVVLVGFFFLVNWWMLSNLQDGGGNLRGKDRVVLNRTVRSVPVCIAQLLCLCKWSRKFVERLRFFLFY